MKIKALILTAALISAAAVGAAAYAAADQARTRANTLRPAAASQADAPSASDPEKKTPRANAPTAAQTEVPAVPEGTADGSGPVGSEVPGATETEPAEPTEPTEPTDRETAGELTAPAALQDPVGEGECLLVLRGGALYVTTLRSFGGEVVYSRALPEGRQLSARDAARLEAGIIYGSPEAAVAAVWELLT